MALILFSLFGNILILYFSFFIVLPYRIKPVYHIAAILYLAVLLILGNQFMGQLVTPFMIAGFLLIIYLGDRKHLINPCCSLITYLLGPTIDYIINGLCYSAFDIDLSTLQKNYIIPYTLFMIAFCFFSSFLLKKLIRRFLLHQDFTFPKEIMPILFFVLVSCVAVFCFNIIYGEKIGYSPDVILMNCIIFCIFFLVTGTLLVFMIRTILNDSKMKLQMTEYKNLQEYTQKTEELYINLRGFKHDYINILTSIGGYIENNDMKGLASFYKEELFPMEKSLQHDTAVIASLSYIEIPDLKALLYSKCIHALNLNLHVDLEVKEPISTLHISHMDLCRILGIFLDNAIEEACQTEEKELIICIFYTVHDSSIVLVRNSCHDMKNDMEKLYEAGYSTKGDNRGLGLSIVKKLLDKYPNIQHSQTVHDHYFTQQIELFFSA